CKLTAYRKHLHSFPTRRSSDLILYDIYTDYIYTLCLKQRCEILTARNSAESPPRNCNNRWQHLTGWRMSFWQKRTSKESDQSDIDRKSTRLNSSHEWISYAVFC